MDGGSPKRGDSIPLTITFDVSCESTGAVVADPQTGQVFFRAPGLTGSIYRKQLSLKSAFHLLDLVGQTRQFVNRLRHFEGLVLQNLQK